MPRVLIVRGHLVTPWELRPWLELPVEFEVGCLLTRSNQFTPAEGLKYIEVRSLRDLLPPGSIGEAAAGALGDRYVSAEEAFAWADIVHAEELSFWFSAEAAKRRRRHGFRLVQTIWETLPMLATFRNRHARRNRDLVLSETDLFLPTTERAALALRLEGVPEARIRICPPGIDVDRFRVPPLTTGLTEHIILSPGRLVWEKGHHDVLRALALLHAGIFTPRDTHFPTRLMIIGSGPEEQRLRAYAAELGIGPLVEILSLPYDEMPAAFARASVMVLASLPRADAAYHPFDVPRAFWEEQFGLVLTEAMAANLDIIASTSGAIPEVLAGTSAQLVAPGDWIEIARRLATGALHRLPGERVQYPDDVVERFSTSAAAARLANAYNQLN